MEYEQLLHRDRCGETGKRQEEFMHPLVDRLANHHASGGQRSGMIAEASVPVSMRI
jgi:hypothetical protein